MAGQQSFTDIEYGNRKRKTKRDKFLEAMEKMVPWKDLTALIEPYYYSGKRGRPPRGAEIMLRMYLLREWFDLSDEGTEEAIYDSYAFRKFMGVEFSGADQAPDATTLYKFRRMLRNHGITEAFSKLLDEAVDDCGKVVHSGSINDAVILNASNSAIHKSEAGK